MIFIMALLEIWSLGLKTIINDYFKQLQNVYTYDRYIYGDIMEIKKKYLEKVNETNDELRKLKGKWEIEKRYWRDTEQIVRTEGSGNYRGRSL